MEIRAIGKAKARQEDARAVVGPGPSGEIKVLGLTTLQRAGLEQIASTRFAEQPRIGNAGPGVVAGFHRDLTLITKSHRQRDVGTKTPTVRRESTPLQ